MARDKTNQGTREDRLVDIPQQLSNLDRAIALERVGGDEQLLREIAILFLDEYPKMLKAIQLAVENRDAGSLERAAHGLKGSVGNFGAHRAYQAALRLEMIGRSRDLASVGEAYGELVQALESIRPALLALCGN